MIRKIEITKFRLFENQSFTLGKRVTIISGHNATGKSTLLGILGNSGELKSKFGKTINDKQFRTEFSEVFKATKDKDPVQSKQLRISFSEIEDFNTETDHRYFRSNWVQERKTLPDESEITFDRFRFTPKRYAAEGVRQTEAKFEWPTYYLGLSRLYPVGEIQSDLEDKQRKPVLSEEEKNWFSQKYNAILNNNDTLLDLAASETIEVPRKIISGFNTNIYNYICCSAGQDNITQILLTLLSFVRLKEKMLGSGRSWNGGLLLIDELDATLHPKAQNAVFDILYEFSTTNDVQVVFTTHSLSLLLHASPRFESNTDEFNDCQLIYITKANGPISIIPNFRYQGILNDMLITTSFSITKQNKITVYAEDDEARWLIHKLLPEEYLARLLFPNIKLGYQNLLQLLQHDYQFFSTHIFILDSDVTDEDIDNAARSANYSTLKNLSRLPGFSLNDKSRLSIEENIFNFIKNLDGNHPIFQNMYLKIHGFTKSQMIFERGYDTYEGNKKRIQLKAWFIANKPFIEELIVFWKESNRDLVISFINDFKRAFNYAAVMKSIPKLH
jgi:energy-coupling factor transporter ATP-binding protein EcfA2